MMDYENNQNNQLEMDSLSNPSNNFSYSNADLF